MGQELISILIPFKNTVLFLPECLDSISKQTYTNWEAILVDDNSDDDSFELVKTYSEIDNRFKPLKNPGNGIIEALRCAYNNSKGEFITRMDSDDIMMEHKLETLFNNLSSMGTGHVAVGLVKYFSEDGISPGYKSYEEWLNKLSRKGENYSEIYKECVIPSPCWMLNRDDLESIDAFKPNNYPEDYDLTFRCYEFGLKCIPCNTVLHLWRDYPTRTSRTHEHYAQNYFLEIKLRYFLKLDHDKSRPLAIWGAGNKGKEMAKMLVEKQKPFYWICDNPKKIGKDIYGQPLMDFTYLKELENPQSIITVANPEAQMEIRQYMADHDMRSMTDYFFFC